MVEGNPHSSPADVVSRKPAEASVLGPPLGERLQRRQRRKDAAVHREAPKVPRTRFGEAERPTEFSKKALLIRLSLDVDRQVERVSVVGPYFAPEPGTGSVLGKPLVGRVREVGLCTEIERTPVSRELRHKAGHRAVEGFAQRFEFFRADLALAMDRLR